MTQNNAFQNGEILGLVFSVSCAMNRANDLLYQAVLYTQSYIAAYIWRTVLVYEILLHQQLKPCFVMFSLTQK